MSANGDKLNEEQQNQLLFMMLIQQHQQIAMMGMGKLKNPATDKMEKDMSSAKYAIDTLNMIQKYTEGNLPADAKNYLEQVLVNLRLNYSDEAKKDKSASSSSEKKEE